MTSQTRNLYLLPFLKLIAQGYKLALRVSGLQEDDHGRHKQVFYIGIHGE